MDDKNMLNAREIRNKDKDSYPTSSPFGYFLFTSYLQLLLLEHVRSGGVENVVGKLGLTIDVDRCCGFTGQEAVVDLPGALRELEKYREVADPHRVLQQPLEADGPAGHSPLRLAPKLSDMFTAQPLADSEASQRSTSSLQQKLSDMIPAQPLADSERSQRSTSSFQQIHRRTQHFTSTKLPQSAPMECKPAGERGRGDEREGEAGSLQVLAGCLRGPAGPGNGRPGSYSWVGAGCCSWLRTIRRWTRRRTPGRCSGPGAGCGGAAAASLSAHGLAASAGAPPLLLHPLSSPLPQLLLSSPNAGRGHRGELRGEGEGGQPGVDRGGSGHFSELAEEAEVGEAPRPRGWGSRPAGMKGGCPSGVARRCGCGSEDPRGRKFPMPLSLLLLVLWFCWASLSGSWKARARTPSMLSPMSR
ncbi:hypothetical protein F7725_015969 [Dissostichus mawsoni]|uniref:Uncharacterized protein n=1 Tax=Dissostichus mawsoni TaxID=36200 RepID=A0A7J5Y4E7_DISMA|nr:hypothetical protein F7725_015969 [Dissostichus mawsoni]